MITMQITVTLATGEVVPTIWRYSTYDPMVFSVQFPDDVDSVWNFGRELVAQAVYKKEKAGVGDILITPMGNRIIVQIYGINPETEEWFESRMMFFKWDIKRILDKSYQVCGEEESSQLVIDKLVGAMAEWTL